jgi:competence protein ComEA
MAQIPPRQLALYGLGLVAALLLAVWYLGSAREGGGGGGSVPSASSPAIRVDGDGPASALTVHVAGAVRHPGVYHLRAGSRVDDAVARAGGPRPRADLSALNLAAKLEDGRQVLVPARAPPAAQASSAAPATGSTTPGVPLNLNTATAEQLDQLDGIGPTTAQQIVGYRDAHDGFGSVDELDQVPGIGEKRLAGLREQVRV